MLAVMGFCAKGEDNGARALKMEAKYWGEIGYYTLTPPGLVDGKMSLIKGHLNKHAEILDIK